MFRTITNKNFLGLILLAALTACAQNAPLDISEGNLAQVMNIRSPSGEVLSSGQPSAEEFQHLAAAGVKHIVNLRPATEQPDFDEGALVRSLGMQYHTLPIAGAADITSQNAQTLDELLSNLDGQPVLIHCASGNRVGALRAMTALESGMSVDDAITEGGRWGLTGMAPAVRTVLSAHQGQ